MTDGNGKRPSLREAARRGAAAKQQAPPAEAATPDPVKPAGKRVEQVQAACGHAVPLELRDDKKDKYQEERRKALAERPCPDCRRKAHEERTEAERKAAEERRRKAPADALASRQQKDRLPHGSRFDVAWDAEKGQWSGTLAIPAEAGGEAAVFTAESSGVFPLLRWLDTLYRKSLPAGKAEAAQGDGNRDVGGEG
jgi:hypothetical protein